MEAATQASFHVLHCKVQCVRNKTREEREEHQQLVRELQRQRDEAERKRDAVERERDALLQQLVAQQLPAAHQQHLPFLLAPLLVPMHQCPIQVLAQGNAL